PIKGPDNRPQEVMVMIQDLSDLEVLRRSEARYRTLFERLRAAEERLRTLVANAPVVLFALDADGAFTLAGGRALAALDLTPGELVGQSAYDVYRDAPQALDSVRRALAGEEFTSVVDVGRFAFETRYTPVRDAEGRIKGLICVATDVTERHRL